MSRAERREQLVEVARGLFAEKGLEGTSVEEIATHAEVSKPVVYEHFGGKEGLYAVVVEREVRTLHDAIHDALSQPATGPRALIEVGTMTLLDYIEEHPDGFRIISRDSSPYSSSGGSFSTILSSIATRVEGLLGSEFERRGFDAATAPLYSQMLVGLVGLSGQWWRDARETTTLAKPEVAAHLVNLIWNGLKGLDPDPTLYLAEHEGPDTAQLA
ncbi:MAG: TetR/AcrR family transcriptional regulator [Propioniciclava sp.]